MVDKSSSRALLKFQCPQIKDSDIPHRAKLREEILVKAGDVEERLKDYFKVNLLSSLELC